MMQWRTNTKGQNHNRGDIQFRWVFAWWPRKCSDGITRWLETITVKEVFTDMWIGGSMWEVGWKEVECYPKGHFDISGRNIDTESPAGELGNKALEGEPYQGYPEHREYKFRCLVTPDRRLRSVLLRLGLLIAILSAACYKFSGLMGFLYVGLPASALLLIGWRFAKRLNY